MNAPTPISGRLVLSRPDRLGDVVITSSCLEPVSRALPGVEIYLLAQAAYAPLFHQHPHLAGFLPLSGAATAVARQEEMAEQLRRLAPSCLVHLQPHPEIEAAGAMAGIPRRVGFRLRGDKWLTESVPFTKKRGEKHEGYYNFEVLDRLGVTAPPQLRPCLSPEPAARERLAKKLPEGFSRTAYAVLHVGAHPGKSRVPAEIFAAVARGLVAEKGRDVVLIGAEKDDADARGIRDALGPAAARVFDLCGQTDVAEMAWLLRDAGVVFGRDSGPAHVAAAMGARTVTLMLEPDQVNSARRWTPLGEHSRVLEKPLRRRLLESRARFARRNLRQYTPEEIAAAVKSAMEA